MLFNRRSMFTAGAVTALALSTPQIMTRAAFAAAPPKSDITNTGFYRFMLGEFEITVILDGSRISMAHIRPSAPIGTPRKSYLS